jgi:hypothetical protein
MNLNKFDGAVFSEYRIVVYGGDLYRIGDISRRISPSPDIYTIHPLKEGGEPLKVSEKELTDFKGKLEYKLDLKGYIPDIMLNGIQNFVPSAKYERGYATIKMIVTQDEWTEAKLEYFKDETYFKVIGIHINEWDGNKT